MASPPPRVHHHVHTWHDTDKRRQQRRKRDSSLKHFWQHVEKPDSHCAPPPPRSPNAYFLSPLKINPGLFLRLLLNFRIYSRTPKKTRALISPRRYITGIPLPITVNLRPLITERRSLEQKCILAAGAFAFAETSLKLHSPVGLGTPSPPFRSLDSSRGPRQEPCPANMGCLVRQAPPLLDGLVAAHIMAGSMETSSCQAPQP